MNKNLENQIWELAMPYLKKGSMKDFVLHTKGVVRAAKILLSSNRGDANLLIPAAILHDTGWAKIPRALQKSSADSDREKAQKLHLEYGALVAGEILEKLDFDKKKIDKIKDMILSHKFTSPRDINKRLLISIFGSKSLVFRRSF